MDEKDCLTLPDYEVKPYPHGCPWCGGFMTTITLDLCPFYGFDCCETLVNNVRVYRCVMCSWEITPRKSFDVIREVLNERKARD